MGKVRPEQNQVSGFVFAKAVGNDALPFAVTDEREFELGMIVPIEGKIARHSFVRSEGSKGLTDFFKSGQHEQNSNTISNFMGNCFSILLMKYM